MSGSAPIPKPRASLKNHDEDDSSVGHLGSPPPFKPPPPRPKTKPVAAVPSNEESTPSSKDEFIHPSQVELEVDPPKDKTPTKNVASRVAPPVPKSEQTPKPIADSPKRPAPGLPRHANMDPAVPDTKVPSSTTAPSPSIPSGPKHSRSVSTGHKLPHSSPADSEHKPSHSRNMSEHLADDISPKITPKRVAPPPPTSGGKGDKKPPRHDEQRVTVRSESCQQFTNVPSSTPGKQKELKPKEKKAPAVPAPKQPPQATKTPQKQSSFEGSATKGTNSPPQRSSPKAARKMSNPENRTAPHDDEDGEPVISTKDRIKKSGIALPIALLKEGQTQLKKKEQQETSPALSRSHPTEPTISYMESPMLATDDTSRKVKFSRQLKTWLTYASEEYDRANDVNVVQAAVVYELEKLIEKMHIYSVELIKCDNVLGMHIRSQNLNSTPEVGGQILGIFVSNVSTKSPADLSGSIQVGDLLLEVDGKPMIGSSRTEAMRILNDTGECVQLTLGRPSSPILLDKMSSPVVKDAPVDIGQSPPSPGALKSPTSPTTTDPARETIRPRSRSATPEKPKPPPTHSKPKVPPPKPPRVKPRTHVGGAHLSGDQREGQTPTPPTARDDAPSSEQPPPTAKKVEKAPDNQEQESTKDGPAAVETEAPAEQQQQQQLVGEEAKVPPEILTDLASLKEENAKLLKDKEDMQTEMKAYQLKVRQEHAQKEAEWKDAVQQLQNELQEKSDLLSSAEQVKKQEMEQLEHRMEESEIATAENMELLNSKVKETRAKYMELLGDFKEMEAKNKDMITELETSRKNLQLSEEQLKNKETEYEAKIAAMEEKAAKEEKDSEEPVKVMDDSEIERLKEELSTVREEKEKELSELRTELEDMKAKESDKGKQLAELNEELASTKKTLKDNKTLLVALKEDLKSAQSCMDQMQGRNRGLTDQLKEEKDERKKKEERLIELTIEAKKYQDETASLKAEMEAIRKQLDEAKEELKKKDGMIPQDQTQGVSTAKEKTDKSLDTGNVEEESKEDDQQYINIDTSSGDVEDDKQYVNVDTSSGDVEKEKEDAKEDKKCDGPEDYDAEYVNVPVDTDKEKNKEVKNEELKNEEEAEVPDFDQVVKTEKLSSTSLLMTRAKPGTLLKRKPPSRGFVHRTASQENLFEIGNNDDYVNLPPNKAVIQQPTHKAEDSNKAHKKEDDKPTDSGATKGDKADEKEVKHEASSDDKPPVASNETPVENKAAPPVAEKPHPKSSPIPQVRRHKVGGVPIMPVTHQMEEILNRQRLATESAIKKDSDEGAHPRSVSYAKSQKFPPPAVKKKPVRAPVKSSDFLDDEKKPHEASGGLSRSLENLATTGDEEGVFTEQDNNGDKLNKRISMSMSVEDIKELKDPVKDIRELKDPVKPPAVKARKMLPGAVRLIAPKPREGHVELAKTPEDEQDSTLNQDKEKNSPDRSRPQTPETTHDSPDNKDDDNDAQTDGEKLSEATGTSGNADILLLPEWTTDEVCIWLQRCGLGELATCVKLGNVTGKILMDMDIAKMKALGMFNNNDRKTLQKEIKTVKTEHDRLKKAEKKKAEAEKKQAKKEEKKKKK